MLSEGQNTPRPRKSCNYVHMLMLNSSIKVLSSACINIISTSRVNASLKTVSDATTHNTKNNSPDSSQGGKDFKSESTPLLRSSIVQSNSYLASETNVTFADIPMPGLWEKDEAGKNTDRIIILLFILLASMIVVSA